MLDSVFIFMRNSNMRRPMVEWHKKNCNIRLSMVRTAQQNQTPRSETELVLTGRTSVSVLSCRIGDRISEPLQGRNTNADVRICTFADLCVVLAEGTQNPT